MRYTSKQYAQALYEALHDSKDSEHDKVLDNFVQILQQHGDIGKFPEIEQAFIEYEKEAKGIKIASATTARKMTNHEEEKLVRQLNDYLGSRVELKNKIDEGLVGGVVVRVEDKLIDGSIKRNLRDLKNNLTE